jgi:hypothetical protein
MGMHMQCWEIYILGEEALNRTLIKPVNVLKMQGKWVMPVQ